MKNTVKILSVLFVLALTAGCIKETFPQGGTVTKEQVAESTSALQAMANSIPSSMMTSGVTGYLDTYNHHGDFGIPAIHLNSEFLCGDVATSGQNPYYNRFYFWCMGRGMDKESWPCSYPWDVYYPLIKSANDIISAVDPANAIQAALYYLGQAYAYRASFYLDLARFYEPKENKYTDVSKVLKLTVPLVTDKTDEKSASNNPRVDRETMYNFILEDLANAEKYINPADKGYTTPTLGAVYGLFARTYLEMGYWDGDTNKKEYLNKAAEYAQKAITTSGRTPLTQAQWEDPTTGFNSGAACNAWIWGATLSSENTINIITFTAHISSEAMFGYAPLSQLSADKNFYNRINDADFRKHSWLDPAYIADPAAELPYAYKFAGKPSDKETFLNGNPEEQISPACAYENIKFRPAQGEVNDYAVANCADHPFMRVEEMYFIKAEAEARGGNLSGAIATLEGFMANRYVGATYTCPATDEASFIEELIFQKRVEFWGEGITIFDLKRNNMGFTRGYDGTNHASVYAYNSDGRSPYWNFVITRGETQSNLGIPDDQNNPDPSNTLKLWVAGQ